MMAWIATSLALHAARDHLCGNCDPASSLPTPVSTSGTGQSHVETRNEPEVGLRALKEILHDLEKLTAVRAELYHAGGNTATRKLTVIEHLCQARPQRQSPAEFVAHALRVQAPGDPRAETRPTDHPIVWRNKYLRP